MKSNEILEFAIIMYNSFRFTSGLSFVLKLSSIMKYFVKIIFQENIFLIFYKKNPTDWSSNKRLEAQVICHVHRIDSLKYFTP